MLPTHLTLVSKERAEKIDNYYDLKFEMKRIGTCWSVQAIPIMVIGALGTVREYLEFGWDSWECHIP